MEKIKASKKEYLLEAPLEVFHEESIEWLKEIDFWKDEVAFFYKLLKQKGSKNSSILKTSEAMSLEKHLIRVSVEKLDEIKLEVRAHEQFLSKIMDDAKNVGESFYRSRHKDILVKIYDFENEFKTMKKEIFLLVKHE